MQCAKRGTPTGGDIDTIPPTFTRAVPENFSTNFNRKEIRIYFDEYIKLNKPQEQIIISPPMSPKPQISPLGSPQKYIRINIEDTLEENTTYLINFGQSVVDNNENNPLPFFKYVFSTGSYIDSLTVSGTVQDALLKEPEAFVSIMLYEKNENYTDSLVYTEPPRYITNTLDSLKTFELTNLKEGTYQMVALKDLNNDYKFNPGKEKIAFIEEPVTIPTDTSYNLVLFKEKIPFQPERASQLAQNKLLIGYRGTIIADSISIQPLDGENEDFDYRITKVADKDSIHFWYKPIRQRDSLRLQIESPLRTDTVFTRLSNMPVDSLKVTTEPSGSIDFGKNVILKANTPIIDKNDSLISIRDRDSVKVDFTSELREFENSLLINFKKDENQTYQITFLPGAVTDFFNATNDTIKKSVTTKALSEYGNLSLTLQNARSFPMIVQLTDEAGVLKAETYTTSETNLRFEFITPGKYLLRIIYDENENRMWDTGNFLEKRKPEDIIYLPKVLEIRPNWDVTENFILN